MISKVTDKSTFFNRLSIGVGEGGGNKRVTMKYDFISDYLFILL